METKILIYLTLGGILLTCGDIILKKWALENTYFLYIGGMLAYILGIVFFSLTLQHKNLTLANIILLTVNIISLALVSWLYFGEKLTTLQVIGLIMASIGIILVELGE